MTAPITANLATARETLAEGDLHRAAQYARSALEAAAELALTEGHRAEGQNLMAQAEDILARL